MNKQEKLNQALKYFQFEAENFFVTKFLSSEIINAEFRFCLDVIFNLTGEKDITKGVIAFNKSYGQSKTFFFDVIAHRHKRVTNKNLFRKVKALELCDLYLKTKDKENPTDKLDEIINAKNLFIDDIGEELKEGRERMVFGNKLNVLKYVLLKRYDLWIQKGYKTFGTTNLSIDQIAKNYDGRVADRLLEMCYYRQFKFLPENSSFRQRTDTRRLTQEEIRNNVLKLQKKQKTEKIDLDKYFNEMILEPEEKLHAMGSYFWTFCKDYLIKKGLLKKSDFDFTINEETLKASRSLILIEKKNALKSQISDTLAYIRRAEEVVKNITDEDVRRHAEGIKAKQLFFTLKQENHQF